MTRIGVSRQTLWRWIQKQYIRRYDGNGAMQGTFVSVAAVTTFIKMGMPGHIAWVQSRAATRGNVAKPLEGALAPNAASLACGEARVALRLAERVRAALNEFEQEARGSKRHAAE